MRKLLALAFCLLALPVYAQQVGPIVNSYDPLAVHPGAVTGAIKGTGAQAACADLSNGGTACPKNTGTSGNTVPLLDGTNTWSNAQTLSVAPVFTDQSGSRTALGLGTAATQATGTSGATVPLNNGANTWSGAQTFQKANTEPAGNTGTGTFLPEGVTHAVSASVNTATGTGEQILDTYNLPANSLDVVGRYLRIRYFFNTANNTDLKTAKCYFGSQVFTTSTSTAAKMLSCEVDVVKTGSSTQNVIMNGTSGATVAAGTFGAGVETDTAAITIKGTCTDGTSAASDCTLVGGTVEFMN
jgi:hypothetical protein